MCGRVSVSKLCMDKLCCMYVCMHICMYVCIYIYMYLCMYACMYVSMDAYVYIYIYIHMSIYGIYMSMYGRSAGTFIYLFSRAERRHGRDEDGKLPGYRKMRLLLSNMMLGNSSSER